MTLNGLMAVILRYFAEFGKHAFQHITASICAAIYPPFPRYSLGKDQNRYIFYHSLV